MRYSLAWKSLLRRPARSLLALLGVAVSAAMLLDMVMLSSGMRQSFRTLLSTRGFDIRLSPRGTLPFDTEATMANVDSIQRILDSNQSIATVSPLLGNSLHIVLQDSTVTAIGLGVVRTQGDYELVRGSDPGADGIVLDTTLARVLDAEPGDTLRVAAGFDPQLATYAGERRLVVSGVAHFFYLSRNQLAAALPLNEMQSMLGRRFENRASLMMLQLSDGADAQAVRAWIEERVPSVTATSITDALDAADARLSYFRQLAFILGSVSLVVGFLLITTLVTVSVNERTGEIAVMRAIGVSRGHIMHQIMFEALTLSVAGTISGLLLGLVTARYLNSILSDFPGLPIAIDFFLFQPSAAWRALGMLVLAGAAAGAFPSWRAASLPISATLRREAVA